MMGEQLMKAVMYSIIFVVLISSVLAVDIIQITDTEGTEASIDIAFDSVGNSHLVYERSGTVFYRYNHGIENAIGSGNAPVICVDDEDIVHLAYLEGTSIYYANKDDVWNTPEHVISGKEVDIACDSIVHVAYTNTDRYQDIMYTNIDDGIVSSPVLIKDGFFYSDSWGKSGRYYYNPRITSDGSNYFIAYKHHAVDGGMSWNDYATYIQVYSSTDSITRSSPEKYKAHYAGLSKNALSYHEGPVVFYSFGTTLYKGTGNWNQEVIDTASAPGSHNNQYAYVVDGEIRFFDGTQLIVVGQGSDPAVGNSLVYFTMNGDIYRTGTAQQEDPCIDNDGDGYYVGEGCELPRDCNDNNPNSWRVDSYWVDYDGDGYHLYGLPNMNDADQIAICYGEEIPYPYVEQTLGRDCDDDNAELNVDCDEGGNNGDEPGDDEPHEVPEFGVLAILGVLVLVGLFVARRR